MGCKDNISIGNISIFPMWWEWRECVVAVAEPLVNHQSSTDNMRKFHFRVLITAGESRSPENPWLRITEGP